MKIALYIEDGLEQIVLTPQTTIEENILSKLKDQKIVKIYEGTFYRCQGGWMRHSPYENKEDRSTIFVIEKAQELQPRGE